MAVITKGTTYTATKSVHIGTQEIINYREVSREKQKRRSEKIPTSWRIDPISVQAESALDVPRTCGLLSSREIQITEGHDAVELVASIANKTYTAREVSVAFCKRAAIAQQMTNCLTEIFFDEAIARAEQLDLEQREHPSKALRPLHGLPISLKDSFRIPAYDSTIGLICFANKPDSIYSCLPQLLLDLGAVLYCKTNVPQTMMTADSDNNVFGRTLNPVNLDLTAGGSSGGEGALVAMRGSILGVGTDVAGSIRIPSLCNGVYGFRPSAGFVPYSGQRSPGAPGTVGVDPVAGPLATSLRSCTFLLEQIANAEPWNYDASCLHLRLFSGIRTKRPRIGFVHNDGMYTPWPPVRRNMSETLFKLRMAGFDVVELQLPNVPDLVQLTYRMFSLDGCKFVQKLISDGQEPQVESVRRTNLASIPSATLEDYFALNAQRYRLQAAFKSFWTDKKLDALVCPPAATTATEFDTWLGITYTMIWNLLDYPAVIIPTGNVSKHDIVDELSNATFGDEDRANYALYKGYEVFRNAPLAVQVVGMRQEDDRLAEVAALVDEVVRLS